MKTCPVCNAIAFDDQATCYGCLYSFEKDEPPTFLLSFVPHPQPSGSFSWTCTVEPVSVAE